METKRSRSPLRFKALRLPGQSGDEAIEALFWDELAPPLLFATVLLIVAIFEWLMALRHMPPQPWLFTSLAVAASLYAARKGIRLRARFRRMRLGRDGERIVAEELDKLRADGTHVFHDVPADGFNIDHVVLCNRGIYAIETKTWSKPQNRDSRIRFTDTGIVVDGHRPHRDPVAQAQATAKWLVRHLKEWTDQSFPVRGTVLIPGWFIEPMSSTWRRSPELPWVLPPSVLRSFIEHEPCRITESDLAFAASALARYIRNAAVRTASI
jgi:Nuclease-related domain